MLVPQASKTEAPAPANSFAETMRLAEIFSKTRMVPVHFQGKPEDCFVAMQMAHRMGVDPMMALQNIYVVGGKPGLTGALIISLINNSKRLKGGIRFRIEGKGEALAVTAFGTLQDGETVEFTASMAMAKAEGWDKNPKYRSMPEVMLRYRAATFLARFNFPEVILGMHSSEEWEDVEASGGVTIQKPASPAMVLAARQPEPQPVPQTETIEAKPQEAEPSKSEPPKTKYEWPEGALAFDVSQTVHMQMVSRVLRNLDIPGHFVQAHGRALKKFLAESERFPNTLAAIEERVRAYCKMVDFTPPADLPEERDEA